MEIERIMGGNNHPLSETILKLLNREEPYSVEEVYSCIDSLRPQFEKMVLTAVCDENTMITMSKAADILSIYSFELREFLENNEDLCREYLKTF